MGQNKKMPKYKPYNKKLSWKPPARKSLFKKALHGLVGLSCLGLVGAGIGNWLLLRWSQGPALSSLSQRASSPQAPAIVSQSGGSIEPKTQTEPVIFKYERGTSLIELSESLARHGLIDHALFFYSWVRLHAPYEKFQAGTYQISPDQSPAEIAEKFQKGAIYNPLALEYTIPEGFTEEKVLRRLEALQVGTYEELKQVIQDETFLKELGISSLSAEGYLYPATYKFFRKMPTPKEALAAPIKKFFASLPENYEENVNRMGLSLQDSITFASLIEMEITLAEEMPMASEVIWRRMKQGIPLGIDASIIYGVENYDGDLKWRHLKDKANKYNTRVHKGLPPGPIGSPSVAALKAVISPTNEGHLYYVLNPEDRKRHHFSKTLAEHNKYVRKLVKSRVHQK